jgi:ferredoxin
MDAVELVSFSPTHGTRTVLQAIAAGCGAAHAVVLDITFEAFPGHVLRDGLVLVGVPVYAGRVPEIAIDRLDKIEGGGRPAVAIVSYGNRAFDDALLELVRFLSVKGFRVIAAAAFIAEHSYSTAAFPVAACRPDSDDLDFARAFGIELARRCSEGFLGTASVDVPGSEPYRERKAGARIVPVANQENCGLCGSCVAACPTGAIPENNPFVTDPDLCIRCAACVKSCTNGARAFVDPGMLDLFRRLHDNCRSHQEPQVFF